MPSTPPEIKLPLHSVRDHTPSASVLNQRCSRHSQPVLVRVSNSGEDGMEIVVFLFPLPLEAAVDTAVIALAAARIAVDEDAGVVLKMEADAMLAKLLFSLLLLPFSPPIFPVIEVVAVDAPSFQTEICSNYRKYKQ